MGVSIHYSATLKSPELLQVLNEEIAELAQEAGWKAKFVGPEPVKIPGSPATRAEGFLLRVRPNMESVNLIFDDTGRMVNYFYLVNPSMLESIESVETSTINLDGSISTSSGKSDIDPEIMIRYASTKTQSAGPAVHIEICKLLQYLNKKYFSEIDVEDETDYWETGHTGDVIEKMRIVDAAINELAGFFSGLNSVDVDDPDKLLKELNVFWKEANTRLPHKPPRKQDSGEDDRDPAEDN